MEHILVTDVLNHFLPIIMLACDPSKDLEMGYRLKPGCLVVESLHFCYTGHLPGGQQAYLGELLASNIHNPSPVLRKVVLWKEGADIYLMPSASDLRCCLDKIKSVSCLPSYKEVNENPPSYKEATKVCNSKEVVN